MSLKMTSNFLDLYDSEGDKTGGGGTTTDDPGESGNQSSTTDPEVEPEQEEVDWPTAPPIDLIDRVKGYELVSFDAVSVPPPPPEGVLPQGVGSSASASENEAGKASEDSTDSTSTPKPPPKEIGLEVDHRITEEQARKALLSFLDDHCCYGKAAAKNMVIKSMEFTPAFHYELQTFSEKRETAWTYSPIRSAFMDNGYGGIPPLPWEIEEYPSQPFKDEVRLVPVPNTASIKSCHRCRGTGGVTCRDCNGKGWSRCLNCHGDGWISHSDSSGGMRDRCFYCQHSKHGHGHQDCAKCHTKGKVNCATCDGAGQIRCYIQLSITWKVHTAEHFVEKLDLPHDLIRDVSGQVAFEEESPKITALSSVTNKDIQQASSNLVASHTNDFSDQRIVRQRHQVRVVPVTHCIYEWKGKTHTFFVYGYEDKVHLKKYPQQCCWGCTLV